VRLSNDAYTAVLLWVGPVLVGLCVLLAARRSTAALLAIVAGVSAVLGAIGYAAWNALPPYKETPLVTYLLLAVAPVGFAAAAAKMLTARAAGIALTWATAVAAFYVAIPLTMVVSAYVLGPLLPNWLGCCPL
jgi:hypothetical protein